MTGENRSRYHLEAAIAACHASAASYEETDWTRILSFYDDLNELAPSPVVTLNRAVAVMMVDGPEAALNLLSDIEQDRKLKQYALLPAVTGDFFRRAGDMKQAEACYAEALKRTAFFKVNPEDRIEALILLEDWPVLIAIGAGMEQRFQNLRDLLDTEVAKIKKDCLSEKKFKQEK